MTLLKTLKLNGMAAAWDDVLSQDKQRKGSFEEVRGALAQAELSHRKAQSIHYQMKLATFPVYRNLAAFDFKASPLSEKEVCIFIKSVHRRHTQHRPGRRHRQDLSCRRHRRSCRPTKIQSPVLDRKSTRLNSSHQII